MRLLLYCPRLFCFSLFVLLWVSSISPVRKTADERLQNLQLWPPGLLQHQEGLFVLKGSNGQNRQALCLVMVLDLGTWRLTPGSLHS